MDFQHYFQNNHDDEHGDILTRIARVIEQDPELALFGVSLASALKGNQLSREQAVTYLSEVEHRLGQM